MYQNYNVLFAGENTATSTSSNSAILRNSYSSKINPSHNMVYPWQTTVKKCIQIHECKIKMTVCFGQFLRPLLLSTDSHMKRTLFLVAVQLLELLIFPGMM